MANPRRNSLANTNSNQSSIFANQTSTPTHANSTSSRIIHFLKKPHAFPFLLSVFLFLTWLSLKLQHSNSHFSPPTPTLARAQQTLNHHDYEDDAKAGLVRFPSGFPSPLAKDTRGWMLDPISLALTHHLSGGAVTCASLHLGEIRPGALRGNHRHHTCNETLVIWGAKTKYRKFNSVHSALMGGKKRKSNWQKRFAGAMNGT
ncbi:uncharacterized protein LOC142609646 isoform X2 [Castanea sativa]|uniref:uncharacterized protein LOC142609646 isoform X2 n=1 Tax=Castanea sativa TaxID=21020 RepID=UPI003F64C3FB